MSDSVDNPAEDNGSDASGTKEACFGDITLLKDASGDAPNSVARGHDQSDSQNTLDHDPPVGAVFVDLTNVDPAEAKRSDGADWASEGVESGSDADTAIDGAGPDAASGASLGASIVEAVSDAAGAVVAAVGAAIGAIF